MAITKVRIKINGSWVNLKKDAESGKWTGAVTAPAATSYHMDGKYYPVTVEATNDAGTVKVWDASDTAWGRTLQLKVREKMKPAAVVVSPSNGAYVTNNRQKITFKVTDEAGGSGIDLASVKLKIDDAVYSGSSEGMEQSEITNGYQLAYTPQTALSDGKHTITVEVSDNDGNAAEAVSAVFTVDTVPPTLTVTDPVAGLITNNPALTVTGRTNDATSSPVGVAIALNGTQQGDVTVGRDGSFSKTVTLKEGTNSIVVTATDAAGKESSVTRSVKLDTTIPEIRSLTLAPNPADASESVAITIEVI